MGAGDEAGVAELLQAPQDGTAYHDAVAGYVDFGGVYFWGCHFWGFERCEG